MIDATPQDLEASLRRTKPHQWEALMGTAAQAWLEQGEAKGMAKGMALGQAELLLNLLEKRFGPLPPEAVTRVRSGSAEAITAWVSAVLDAPNLEAVLSESSG